MLIRLLLRLLFNTLDDEKDLKRISDQRRARLIKMRQQGPKKALPGKPAAKHAVARKATRR